MESLCLCCGDQTECKQRRVLQSEGNRHLVPILCTLILMVSQENSNRHTSFSEEDILDVLNGTIAMSGLLYFLNSSLVFEKESQMCGWNERGRQRLRMLRNLIGACYFLGQTRVCLLNVTRLPPSNQLIKGGGVWLHETTLYIEKTVLEAIVVTSFQRLGISKPTLIDRIESKFH